MNKLKNERFFFQKIKNLDFQICIYTKVFVTFPPLGTVRPDAFSSDLLVKLFWRCLVILKFHVGILSQKVTERRGTLI